MCVFPQTKSGLHLAERAARKLKLESPKTLDKKKMAALLVCHGKVSHPRSPQIVSSVTQQMMDTLKGKRMIHIGSGYCVCIIY
jgi:hypothetical protein